MAKQFLLHGRRGPEGVDQSGIGVPECMPADLAGTRRFRCGLQVICQYAVRPRGSSIRTGKHKIRFIHIDGPRFVRQERFSEVGIQRERGLRGFRLCLIDFPFCNASLYLGRKVFKIDVTPLQTKHLADSQTQAGDGNNHRFVGFRELSQQCPEFCRYRRTRGLHPLP